jgi:hypothetical protein
MKAPNRMGRGKGKGKEGTYVEELLPLELDELLVLLVGSALPDDAPGEVVPGEVVGLRVPCRLRLPWATVRGGVYGEIRSSRLGEL